MNKLKKFIETIDDTTSDLSKFLKATQKGIDMVKELCGKYNSIAQWCGLPQVPTIFNK